VEIPTKNSPIIVVIYRQIYIAAKSAMCEFLVDVHDVFQLIMLQ
jgi:hypothetical protein